MSFVHTIAWILLLSLNFLSYNGSLIFKKLKYFFLKNKEENKREKIIYPSNFQKNKTTKQTQTTPSPYFLPLRKNQQGTN